MLKKTVTYEDFDGNEVNETLYFNLTTAEVIEMEVEVSGGLEGTLSRIVEEEDSRKVLQMLKYVIGKAYGYRTEDGKKFRKSQQATDDFFTSEAYSALIVEFFQDASSAADFFANLAPKKPLKMDKAYEDKTPEQIKQQAMDRMQGHLPKQS